MKVCPLTRISPVQLQNSDPVFFLPSMASTQKEYSCPAMAQWNTWLFWLAASLRYFRGLCSVWSVNLLPA